jgi:hypothetical protein
MVLAVELLGAILILTGLAAAASAASDSAVAIPVRVKPRR